MSDMAMIASGVLMACLGALWLLGKAELFGRLAVIGFVLGSLATLSVFVMFS